MGACLALWLVGASAGAEPLSEGARAARDAAALMTKKQYAEACARFAESQRLEPRPTTQLALAQCWTKAERPLAAIAVYRELGRVQAYSFSAKSAIAVLEKHLGRVAVTIARQSPEPELLRDGAPLAPAERGEVVYVEPGQHTIGAAAPGKKTWSEGVNLKPGQSTQLAVPALEDDASAVAAQSTEIVALRRQGDAEWAEGVGFVVRAPPPPPPPPPQLIVFPVVKNEKLGGGWGQIAGGVAEYSALRKNSLEGGLLSRFGGEFRRSRSYVAPWFDFGVTGGVGSGAFIDAALRVGADVHPRRWTWLGVGPYLGWQVLVAFTGGGTTCIPLRKGGCLPSETTLDHGPELGFLHAHLRTREHEGDPPVFDADLKLAEVIGVGGAAKQGTPGIVPQATVGTRGAPYFGATLGVGGHVRFLTYAEKRLTSPTVAALLVTPNFQAGGGVEVQF